MVSPLCLCVKLDIVSWKKRKQKDGSRVCYYQIVTTLLKVFLQLHIMVFHFFTSLLEFLLHWTNWKYLIGKLLELHQFTYEILLSVICKDFSYSLGSFVFLSVLFSFCSMFSFPWISSLLLSFWIVVILFEMKGKEVQYKENFYFLIYTFRFEDFVLQALRGFLCWLIGLGWRWLMVISGFSSLQLSTFQVWPTNSTSWTQNDFPSALQLPFLQ